MPNMKGRKPNLIGGPYTFSEWVKSGPFLLNSGPHSFLWGQTEHFAGLTTLISHSHYKDFRN